MRIPYYTYPVKAEKHGDKLKIQVNIQKLELTKDEAIKLRILLNQFINGQMDKEEDE